jgi:Tfp pilus assembly protein PilV
MVALMLLSVISLVLTGLIPATITGMHKASQRTNASMLAENELALIRQSGFGNLEPTSPPYQAQPVAGTDYFVKVLVTPATMSDGSTMDQDVAKLVSVEVTWEDRQGDQRHVSQAVMFKRI